MARKKPPPEPESQIERFRSKVRELEAAGEFSPTEAGAAMDKLVRSANRSTKPQPGRQR